VSLGTRWVPGGADDRRQMPDGPMRNVEIPVRGTGTGYNKSGASN